MATYEQLRDRALNRVGCLGQTEAQLVAQQALEEAMKFVAHRVRVPSLIAKATFTAAASPELEANAIPLGVSGFNIAATYQAPDRLYVKKDSATENYGTPYDFLEYHYFIDLKSIPGGARTGILVPGMIDERPQFSYTQTPDSTIWIQPLTVGNVVTFFFRKAPAAYSGASTPEILGLFDYILVDGAELILKEWLREPDTLSTTSQILEALTPSIHEYDEKINGQRYRSGLKIHRSYRPRR